MPGLFGGFGNYFIPIFNTSIEVGYPRINSVTLLVVPLSYVLLLMSMVTSGAGLGWTTGAGCIVTVTYYGPLPLQAKLSYN